MAQHKSLTQTHMLLTALLITALTCCVCYSCYINQPASAV